MAEYGWKCWKCWKVAYYFQKIIKLTYLPAVSAFASNFWHFQPFSAVSIQYNINNVSGFLRTRGQDIICGHGDMDNYHGQSAGNSRSTWFPRPTDDRAPRFWFFKLTITNHILVHYFVTGEDRFHIPRRYRGYCNKFARNFWNISLRVASLPHKGCQRVLAIL